MGRRGMVCVLIGEREAIDLARINCGDQSHHHITQPDATLMVEDDSAEWLKQPKNRHEKGIIRLLNQDFNVRDLSCRIGAFLARSLREKRGWAIAMLQDWRHKAVPPADER